MILASRCSTCRDKLSFYLDSSVPGFFIIVQCIWILDRGDNHTSLITMSLSTLYMHLLLQKYFFLFFLSI